MKWKKNTNMYMERAQYSFVKVKRINISHFIFKKMFSLSRCLSVLIWFFLFGLSEFSIQFYCYYFAFMPYLEWNDIKLPGQWFERMTTSVKWKEKKNARNKPLNPDKYNLNFNIVLSFSSRLMRIVWELEIFFNEFQLLPHSTSPIFRSFNAWTSLNWCQCSRNVKVVPSNHLCENSCNLKIRAWKLLFCPTMEISRIQLFTFTKSTKDGKTGKSLLLVYS